MSTSTPKFNDGDICEVIADGKEHRCKHFFPVGTLVRVASAGKEHVGYFKEELYSCSYNGPSEVGNKHIPDWQIVDGRDLRKIL